MALSPCLACARSPATPRTGTALPVWAGIAARSACSWLLGSLYVVRLIDAWPIAFGACVSILLFPAVLRGVVWMKRGRLKPKLYRGLT
jgi:hypothetical protein